LGLDREGLRGGVSHQQQMDYVRGLIGDVTSRGRMCGKVVLELGSYNVNGAVRDIWSPDWERTHVSDWQCKGFPSRYVGVDWRAGPGVDHISLFHEIPWIEEFDVLISCNAFEHDPYWKQSIVAGLRALKPGGEIILMAAGVGYPAHEVASSPKSEYYQNIDPHEFCDHLIASGAVGVMTVFTAEQDVAFHGHKRNPPTA
jgi:SAM-dependent methyltransferase